MKSVNVKPRLIVWIIFGLLLAYLAYLKFAGA
jgi:hypothetical protein